MSFPRQTFHQATLNNDKQSHCPCRKSKNARIKEQKLSRLSFSPTVLPIRYGFEHECGGGRDNPANILPYVNMNMDTVVRSIGLRAMEIYRREKERELTTVTSSKSLCTEWKS